MCAVNELAWSTRACVLPLPEPAPAPAAAERHRVVLLPDGAARGHEAVVAVALADAATLATGSGEAAHLTVLHDGLADPVDAGIRADDAVRWVHKDDLEVLVHAVHGHPVRVEHAQVAAAAANALLSEVLQVARALELVDGTGAAGLAPHGTLVHRPLAGTAAHAHAVDHEALLGLVPEAARLVRPSGAGAAVDRGKLAVLPHPHTRQEAKHVRLLLLPELLHVLVGTHLDGVPQLPLS